MPAAPRLLVLFPGRWEHEFLSDLARTGGACVDAEGFEATSVAHLLRVPWFDFPVTGEEGLCQVLTHSCEHRAQVLSVLGARGLDVPGLDYVVMLAEARGSKPS